MRRWPQPSDTCSAAIEADDFLHESGASLPHAFALCSMKAPRHDGCPMILEDDVKALRPLLMSGKEVLPLVEGGKGISVSNGQSSGAWAAAGGVGTFSGVNADSYDAEGRIMPQIYKGRTRRERHDELVAFGIEGGIAQARVAHEMSNGQGRLHVNILWEMGGAERILEGILEGAQGMVHGVTCGAGMPYRVAEIAVRHGVHYYPIGPRLSRAVAARL
jgi:nitronate monooxygenase